MSIDRARKAKAEQSLDKMFNINGRVMSRRDFLHMLGEQGGELHSYKTRQYDAEEKLKDKLWRMGANVPIGNPNHPETKNYYALKDQLKEGIYQEKVGVKLPSGTFYELNKTEQEYFKNTVPRRSR